MKFLQNKFSHAFLLLFAVFALIATACTPEDGPNQAVAEAEVSLAQLETEVSANFDEVEEYAFEAMETTDFSSSSRPFADPAERIIPACATVTHDSVAKTILIDFGTGCLGPDGKLRTGQIQLSYTQRLYVPGATLSVTSISYTVDSVAVAGTKTITNVSPNFQSNLSLNVSLVGGQLSFPNGDVVSREVDKTYTWLRAANPALDELHVDGSAQGTNRAGENYSCQITTTLVWKRRCNRRSVRIPVEGVKLIQKSGRPDLTMDFGDGTCDTFVSLSANGRSRVVDFSQR